MAVLIIDDSKLMRYQVRQMLPEQLTIHEAVDGEEGFEKILELRPKLIILDCFMPKLNGWQVVNRMMVYPELITIPVVLMTGRKDEIEDNAPNLFDYFVYDYFELMSKPFDREALVEAIKQAVIKAQKRSLEAPVDVVSPNSSNPAPSPVRDSSTRPSPVSQPTGAPNTLFPSGLTHVALSPHQASPNQAQPPTQAQVSGAHASTKPQISSSFPIPQFPITSPPATATLQLKDLRNEVQRLQQQNANFHRELEQLKQQVLQLLQESTTGV